MLKNFEQGKMPQKFKFGEKSTKNKICEKMPARFKIGENFATI